jgi:NTE family protein
VLQGGGALGSYQAGVYEALAHCEESPDWVAGISIGAINAALIAGNPPERRMARLKAFWDQTSSDLLAKPLTRSGDGRSLFNEASAAWIASAGVPGFFKPRFPPPMFNPPGTPAALSFYDTAALRETLLKLVDFDLINSDKVRLSVGAVNIKNGNFRYFDSATDVIGPEHIMASGALPPGFPPIEIEGEFYWDGGIVSNTPLDYVVDSNPGRDLVIFQVDLFNASGPLPKTVMEGIEREKDIRFASRTRRSTDETMKLHKAKLAIQSLIAKLTPDLLDDPEVATLTEFAREYAVTVVQLIYRSKHYETSSKDYEFSRVTMLDHWAAGHADAELAMSHRPEMIRARPTGGGVFDMGRAKLTGEATDLSKPLPHKPLAKASGKST